MIRFVAFRRFLLQFCLLLLTVPAVFSQSGAFSSEDALKRDSVGSRTANSGRGEVYFRQGVQSYYRGNFNEAIMIFESAVNELPEENVILDWLGKAYYRSGAEGSALQHWEYASSAGYGGPLLKNRIEIVKNRRNSDNSFEPTDKYTEAWSFSGRRNDTLLFSKPVSVLPDRDGTVWVLCYGTNQLIRMDVNGFIVERSNGAIGNDFDRPLDLIRLKDGNMLVSEFSGDRLSLFDSKGRFIKAFGSKGTGVGNVIGPQYLAQDSLSNIYVTDCGNIRVDVFDKDGKGLFFFGQKTEGFEGLHSPTGIAVYDDVIYVADAYSGAVYKFDQAGNYTGLLCREKTFSRPESMKLWNGYLVVCDKNHVYSIDIATGSVFENMNTGTAPSRVTCAVPDINGNILVTDYVTDEVYVMAKLPELAGGFFVQIEKIDSTKFPKVTVDLKVENRYRQSVVGLKVNNFLLTENKAPVQDFKFEGSAYRNETADITVIVDRSEYARGSEEAVNTAVKEIAQAINGKGILRIVSAGKIPLAEYTGSPSGALNFSAKGLKNPYSTECELDSAIRLAANPLIDGEKKSAIILVGSGKVTQGAFKTYGLADLACYLNNNSIALSSVLTGQGSADREIAYLCNATPGNEYYVYREEGLKDIVKDIIDLPSGIYQFSFTSRLKTNFGEKYLPLEAEVYLMNRSGRDETGYFAPLE
ncbi:MAG: NHL repeat-containing protein [Treponema sp.]|nr:NHL repeat-containing protein [Treponema sp.]